MALTPQGGRVFTITSADTGNTIVVGDGSPSEAFAGGVTVQLDSTSFSGTVDIQVSSVEQPVTARGGKTMATTPTFRQALYYKWYLNGIVADGSLVSTQITDSSLVVVPAPGMRVGLKVTCTSGSLAAYVTPWNGVAK